MAVVARRPMDGSPPADPGSDPEADPALRLDWINFPPLPTPNQAAMRQQCLGGFSMITGIVLACLAATHAAAYYGGLSGPASLLLVLSVWTWAFAALWCLRGVQLGDPGVICRSEERCTPVPAAAVRWVATSTAQTWVLGSRCSLGLAGAAIMESLPLPAPTLRLLGRFLMHGPGPLPNNTDNMWDENHGSYCTRCLVWRRRSEKAHHCSTVWSDTPIRNTSHCCHPLTGVS